MVRRGAKDPPTAEERVTEFLRIGDELLSRRVLHNLQYSTKLSFEQGTGLSFESTSPDLEDYRSFWLDLRKFLAPDSPTNFSKAMRAAEVEFGDTTYFATLRRLWNQALNQSPFGLVVNSAEWTPRELIDVWLNGELFHSDLSKRGALREVRDPVPVFADLIINQTSIALVQLVMQAMARMDFLRGGPGIVSVNQGRPGHSSA